MKPQARKFLQAACVNGSMHCVHAGDKGVCHSQRVCTTRGHVSPSVPEAAHVAEVAWSFDAKMYH